MAALILPSRQIVQPQGPVQIDWSNPLARGLAFLTLGGQLLNLANGTRGALVNAANVEATAQGMGWRTDATNKRLDYTNTLPASNFAELSMASVMVAAATQTSNRYLIAKQAASGYQLLNLPSSGALGFSWSPSGFVSGSLDPTPGRVYCVSASSPPAGDIAYASAGLYVDGQSALTSGSSAAIDDSTSQTIMLGNRAADSARGFNGAQLLVAVWARALTPAEHRSFAANPWQLFKPVARRIWIPAATSSGTGTLAATEAGADTATLTGVAIAAGTLAATESSADTAALAGVAPTAGALAVTESGSDALAASSGATALAGTLSASETDTDSAAATAATLAQATLAAAEAGTDSFGATSGATASSGTLAASEAGADTASASGSAPATASLGAIESSSDTASLSGLALVLGLFAATETGTDTATASGTPGAAPAAGALAATEPANPPDSAAISAIAQAAGQLAAVEAAGDTFSSVPPFRLVNAVTTVRLTLDRTTVRRTLDHTTVTT